MTEKERSPHNNCTEHSGLNVRVNLLLGLSGVAVTLLAITLQTLISFKGEISTSLATTKEQIKNVEFRVSRVEDDIVRRHN